MLGQILQRSSKIRTGTKPLEGIGDFGDSKIVTGWGVGGESQWGEVPAEEAETVSLTVITLFSYDVSLFLQGALDRPSGVWVPVLSGLLAALMMLDGQGLFHFLCSVVLGRLGVNGIVQTDRL